MTKENQNTLHDDTTAQPVVVLFDLDYTLISSDCTAHWLRYLLTRSTKRKLLIIALIPIIKLCNVVGVALATRNSLYLWAATVGLSKQRYLALRRYAAQHVVDIKNVRAYQDALDAMAWHRSQGHKIVVITGALRWLARDVCRRLQIEYDVLMGSSEQNAFAGRVSQVFCYADNKVSLLQQRQWFQNGSIAYGYSDSAADIPMLSACEKRVVVNPKPKCQAAFKKAFADNHDVVKWH